SFSAIFFSFNTVLDGRDTAHGIHNFGECILLAFAKMFELVGVIVLAQGLSFGFVNASAKVTNGSPALRLRDQRIADRKSGRLQIVGKGLEIILALRVSQVSSQTIPSQCPVIVGLNALPILIHPAELV